MNIRFGNIGENFTPTGSISISISISEKIVIVEPKSKSELAGLAPELKKLLPLFEKTEMIISQDKGSCYEAHVDRKGTKTQTGGRETYSIDKITLEMEMVMQKHTRKILGAPSSP